MNTTCRSTAVTVERVADRHWHAIHDDRTVGRAEVFRRPDGRSFLSIDAWHADVFDQLARALRTDLLRPLYTIVDEADVLSTSQWQWAGFSVLRREWEYVVPTGPGSAVPPPGITIGSAEEGPLRVLDREIRAEVAATIGWEEMPAEVLSDSVCDPSRYVVATLSGEYVGLLRLMSRRRHARIGLVAVRTDMRRRGVARALLSGVLESLAGQGIQTATADVKESNAAAIALFESVGGRRAGSSLELVLR